MSRDENIQAVFDLKAGYTLGLADIEILKRVARMALAAMDSEPVDEVLSNRPGNDTSTIDRALPVGTQLYRHAQPALVVSADLLHTAASAIEDLLEHTDPNTSYYSGVWADVPGKLRAAMLQAKSLASINPAPALCSLSKTGEVLHTNSPVITDEGGLPS